MRRKQMLGIILPLLLVSVATAESQLTGVKAQRSGANASAVVIQASGRFTHTEYRPNDNLLLVDLSGVSAAAIDAQPHPLDMPAVASYRVQSYTGTNGAEVARVELTLKPHAIVKISEAVNILTVNVATDLSSSAAASSGEAAGRDGATLAKGKSNSAPASSQAPAESAARAVLPRVQSNPTQVRNIAVARGERGMNIEISADGALVSKVIKLSSPDRVVVDLLNSVPVTRQREITVNSGDVKMVRIGRYQTSPPTTRVVVDLTTAHEYEIYNVGNKLIVKLQPTVSAFPKQAAPSQVAALVSPETASPFPTSHKSDSISAAATTAKDFVILEPTYRKELPSVDPAQADSSAKVAFSSNRTGVSQATAAPQLDNSVTAQNSLASSMGKTDSAMAKAEPAKSVAVTELNERKTPAQSAAGESRSAQAARKFTDHKNDVALTNGPVVPATANAAMKIEPALNLAALPQQAVPVATQGGPVASCNTGRYTGEPISVNLKDVDLRDFFRLIHEISGLNIILDADVRGNLTLVLDDVPWDQALSIVLKNSRLDCQLEGNILRIASSATIKAEADAHRAQIEAQALAVDKVTVTRYLSYAVAAELMPAIKQFMSARGDIIADGRTNALIIQDIPATIPNIDRLIHELDRKTKEVEIEARVVAATRNFARDIGTQLGFAFGNGPTAVGGAPGVGLSPNINNAPNAQATKYFTNGKQIPLFSNFPAAGPTSGFTFLNATNNYRIDFLLTLAESRGLVKILSRPRIVTQNNISAIVRQGVKLPIVTAAQLGGPPTVTFVDAFLRLTVKPQITAEGTIFLNVDVENTTPDFGNQVQGNPSLITQQATTSVLVTDGGTVVIGGVIQTTSSVNVSQTPVLGNIPVLGNLFKRRAVQTSTQELMFFITPRVIQT